MLKPVRLVVKDLGSDEAVDSWYSNNIRTGKFNEILKLVGNSLDVRMTAFGLLNLNSELRRLFNEPNHRLAIVGDFDKYPHHKSAILDFINGLDLNVEVGFR